MLDAETATFWFIEIVATDGPINEPRKAALVSWARNQGIDASACRYLTAFASRTSPAARRLFADLAVGTRAWFLDEPDQELSWAHITPDGPW